MGRYGEGAALSTVLHTSAVVKIELPDLDSQTEVEIVQANLDAVQAIYFAFQLQQLWLFQVVERIVERFNGLVILATNLRDDIGALFSNAAKHRWRAVRFPLQCSPSAPGD